MPQCPLEGVNKTNVANKNNNILTVNKGVVIMFICTAEELTTSCFGNVSKILKRETTNCF